MSMRYIPLRFVSYLILLHQVEEVGAYVIETTLKPNKDLHGTEVQVDYLGEFVYAWTADGSRVGEISVEATGHLALKGDSTVLKTRLLQGETSVSPRENGESESKNLYREDTIHHGETETNHLRRTDTGMSGSGSGMQIVKGMPHTDIKLGTYFPVDEPVLQILIFDDQDTHWYKFMSEVNGRSTMTSMQLARCESVKADASRVINLRLDQVSNFEDKTTLGIREHLKPRLWRIMAVFCNVKFVRQEINVRLHLRQTVNGWQNELSMNQYNLPYLYLIIFVAQLGLLSYAIHQVNHDNNPIRIGVGTVQSGPRRHWVCLTILSAWKAFCRGLITGQMSFLSLPFIAIACSLVSVGLYLYFYYTLAQDGLGEGGVEIVGFFLSQFSVQLLWASMWYLATGNIQGNNDFSSVRFYFIRRRLYLIMSVLFLLGFGCDLFLDVDTKLGNYMYTTRFGLVLWISYFGLFIWLTLVVSEVHGGQPWNVQQSKWFQSFLVFVGSWYILQYLLPLVLGFLVVSYIIIKWIVVCDLLARCFGFVIVFHLYRTYDKQFMVQKFYSQTSFRRGNPRRNKYTTVGNEIPGGVDVTNFIASCDGISGNHVLGRPVNEPAFEQSAYMASQQVVSNNTPSESIAKKDLEMQEKNPYHTAYKSIDER